jgi:pimeloyl-ACP methyl ester carboxylesterase
MRFHCTAAAAAAWLFAAIATAQPAPQTPPAPATGDASFGIFLRGTQIGREQVNVANGPSGWIVSSTGASQAPLDFTIARFELKYSADWQPLEMTLDARLRSAPAAIRTSFGLTTAINEVTQNGRTVAKEDQISAKTVVLPNNVFGAYEALAVRLWNVPADGELPIYVVPQAEVKLKVRAVTEQSLTGPSGAIPSRRFDVTFQNPDRPVDAIVTVDNRQRLLRFEIPQLGLLVVRDDAASVAMRPEVIRNPTDADVTVQANGFNLAATVTTPPAVAARLRHPVIVLVGGAAPPDRDEVIRGVPIFAQLARGLSDAGDMVIRYDRRGSGQSGGRTDTATISDYADDALAVIRWASRRDDVDKRRLVVAGYGDGAAVALLAASRSDDIDAVVTLDAAGTRGVDLILEQQQRVLDGLKLPPAERQARIDLQRRILAAVSSGGSWEGVPDVMRRQADTPWFRSVLQFDPAQIVPKIRQPILILHGELDATIPPSEADRLGALAKARKKAPASEVARIPGVTQTLAPPDGKTISPQVAAAIVEFVKKL